MIQIEPQNDTRYEDICCYCQKQFDNDKTRDHIPSKVLLDKPYPENLPIAFCCFNCNQSFSTDEEYFACIIEYLIAGTKNAEEIQREKIRKILNKKENLKKIIEKNINETNGELSINFAESALKNIIKKIIFGHLSYELSNPYIQNPKYIEFNTIDKLNDLEFQEFINDTSIDIAPEIGTRASLGYNIKDDSPFSSWKIVQENNYQYKLEILESETVLKVIIRNKVYIMAIWNN